MHPERGVDTIAPERARTAPPWAAILLAAGGSTRFGERSKALAPVDGEPSLARIARLSAEDGFAPVVGVIGGHADETRRVLERVGATVVENPEWGRGRTGSLQRALAVLDRPDTALVWPVDFPFVRASTLTTLRAASAADPLALWVIPTFEGHGGHPVLIRRSAWPFVMGLREDEPLRTVLPKLGPQVLRVAVSDPGVVSNVDTQEAFAEALSEWRLRNSDR